MVSLYKRLLATYLFVGVLCIIGGTAFLRRHSDRLVVYYLMLIVILCITIGILTTIAKKKFKSEILSHLDNCRVGIFLEELTKLMGKRRDKRMRSFYSSLCAVGYEALGDYDSLFASCQNIKLKAHMPVYHRRMCSYYIERNEIDYAKDAITALSALAAAEKNQAEKKLILQMEEECRRALQVHMGEYGEPLKYYKEMLKSTEGKPLISRVSYAYSYGSILFMTGDKKAAEEPLLFASSRGGDTKYKKRADKLLAEIR